LYYSGNTLFLDHGAGLITAYFHLSRTMRAVGDTVERGQVIGHVGATGRVTGPHLHWHAAYGTVSVDPLDLLTFDLAAPKVRRKRLARHSAVIRPSLGLKSRGEMAVVTERLIARVAAPAQCDSRVRPYQGTSFVP
jgi:hypothetical protein